MLATPLGIETYLYRREGLRSWGTAFIKFLAAVAILHQDVLKNTMNSSVSSYHPGAKHPFLYTILVQNSLRGKDLNKFCPPDSSLQPLPSLFLLL